MSKHDLKAIDEELPFWRELEEMLHFNSGDQDQGHLAGSMSGESWKAFLKTVRDEVLQRLEEYSVQAGSPGFCASSLGPFWDEKQKIEKAYLRNLAVLYRSAEKAYKTLSG